MTRLNRGSAILVLGLLSSACEPSQVPTAPSVGPLLHVAGSDAVVFEAELATSSVTSVSCALGVCTIVFEGSGGANIMGAVSYSAKVVQDFTTAPCNEALAEVALVGSTGSITLADGAGSICPQRSPGGFPAFVGSEWTVAGGTGEFDGISGSGTSSGPIGGNAPVVHMSGTVSY